MMIHELKSIKKRVQRIGRSGKRGSYSGRGQNGQKSRAGRRLRPAERDLIMRIPKKRGYDNLRKSDVATIFNMDDLAKALKSFAAGKGAIALDQELLKVSGLLKKGFKGDVKLLGDGEMTIPLTVKIGHGIKVSESAKMKIEKAGGSVAN